MIPGIIYAADVGDTDHICALLPAMRSHVGVVKLTPHVLVSGGLGRVRALAEECGMGLFLDLKLHDIPNTVYNAVVSVAETGACMLTVHISGGGEMLEAAVRARRDADCVALKILGVTRLTSASASEEEVVGLALEAKRCGLDGVICSALEASAVKEACGEGFLVVSPGIRTGNHGVDDQCRTATPMYAARNGVDYIVIGRQLSFSDDKDKLLKEIVASMQS